MSGDKKPWWLRFLSIASLVVPLLLILFCWIYYKKTSPGVDPKPLDNYTQNALNIVLESSNSLASLAILLLSGVWGFIFSQKEKVKAREWYILLPLVGGSVALAFSYVCYRNALNKYAEILFKVSTVDLFSPIIQFWPQWQLIFFALGFLILVVSLYVTYIIRR